MSNCERCGAHLLDHGKMYVADDDPVRLICPTVAAVEDVRPGDTEPLGDG